MDTLAEIRRPSSCGCWAVADALLALSAGLGVAWAAGTSLPRRPGLDPVAGLSSLYILVLYCFQSSFLEWPERGIQQPQLHLAASLGSLLLPSMLAAKDLWHGAWRGASSALSAALAVSAYRSLVRGPRFEPTAGSLAGRVCLVTGANSGIGYETSKALARGGATVVFACRDEQRATTAMEKLLEECQALGVVRSQLRFVPLDLSSLRSVRRCAELLQESGIKVHTLVLNAGIMRRHRSVTEDGFEMTLASNHLGHFLLVHLLLPGMLAEEAAGAQPRVVVVGSNMCYLPDQFDFSEVAAVKEELERTRFLAKPYELFRAYAQSKLANLLFTRELSRRLQRRGSRIPANCVHPGEVLTQVMNDMHPLLLLAYGLARPICRLLFKTPQQGSVCSTYVAASPELSTADAASGEYFMRLRPAVVTEVASNPEVAQRLWSLSEELTGASPAI